jgi:spermidine synthase
MEVMRNSRAEVIDVDPSLIAAIREAGREWALERAKEREGQGDDWMKRATESYYGFYDNWLKNATYRTLD